MVEEIDISGDNIKNVVVGKIETITKHPNADKLVICEVDIGKEKFQVITGADNITEGDYVPVAVHGAVLPGGLKVKKGKIRGEVSEGMLCSANELGIPSYGLKNQDEFGYGQRLSLGKILSKSSIKG